MWIGAGLLIGVALVLYRSEASGLDLFILRGIAEIRSPLLTNIFVNLTALGSTTLTTLHTAVAFALLRTTRDRIAAWQLVAAWLGAMTLTELTKAWIGRPRPSVVPALVDAIGFSYPSGHSFNTAAIYVTIAAIGFRHLQSSRQRAVLLVFTCIVVGTVGLSRVYLGVHYPSDALAGILMGTAWALIIQTVGAKV